MYKYPYGDMQQLNLDWILAKLKELESGSAGNVDLEGVSNALISLTYNPDTIYARYDYAFRNGKLYRCLSGTSGTFDPDAWQEALIGDDLAILTRWINAINAAAVVDVKFDTSGTNGKIQQKYNDNYHDVVEVDYTPVQNSKRPLSSNAGYELNSTITQITGATVLNNWSENHFYIKTSGNTATINSPTSTSSNVRYLVADCTSGEQFTITCSGADGSRAWAFVDSVGNILDKASKNATCNNLVITAPTNSTNVVINDTSLNGIVIRGTTILPYILDAIKNFRPNQLKRKWIFIGDSYGHASGTNQGWIDKLVPMLGLSASDYYESAAGGYGFAGSYTFLSLLTTLTGNITDKTAITDIVVLGGANDIGVSASAIETAIEAFNTYAYTNYPNAIVKIGMIAACSDTTRVAPQYSRTKEGYSNCGKAQYLHNLEFVFQNRDLVGSDTIHPTPTGYEVLTKKIFEALNGGCNVIYREFGTPTYPAGFNAITGASSYNVIVNNEITTITIPQRTGKIAADSSSYFAVQAGTAIAVFNLPTKLFLTGAIDQHTVLAATTIATVMSKVNENFYQIKGSLFIAGNDRTVYFLPQDIILGTTSAFNSCDRISIDAVAFTAPSIMV